MDTKDESISPEEYGALMEKLTKVEELFEKATSTEQEQMAETIQGLETSIEKLTAEIDILKEFSNNKEEDNKLKCPEEKIQKMVDDAVASLKADSDTRLDVLEKSPLMKGVKDGDIGIVIEKNAGTGYLDAAIAKAYGIKV